MMIAPYHLPALPDAQDRGEATTVPDEAGVLRTLLTPELVAQQADALIVARGEFLADRPVLEIVDVIDTVAARFLAPTDPLRERAIGAIAEGGGLSGPMARRILDGMAVDWRADRLRRTLDAEVGDPRVLDSFVPDPAPSVGTRRMVRGFGPELMYHVFSGNVPGVAVTSLIRALLVKSASFGKTASGEPALAPLFAGALAEADPGLGTCVAVAYWPGGDDALEASILNRAGGVIVYGSDDTIQAVRSRSPARAEFHGYPHRFSIGVVPREAADPSMAARHADEAANAVAMFDQQGCTSPHVFYIEEGGDVSPREWARMLAEAMATAERRLPRGHLSPGESAAILQTRGEAEIAQLANRGVEMHVPSAGTEWTVIFDPDPAFVPSCLNRTVRVKPVEAIELIVPIVTSVGSALQTVGVAGSLEGRQRVAALLGAIGATRITSIPRMPWPPPDWHHDGRPPLGSLVRWCDLEEDEPTDPNGTPLAPRGPHDP